MTLQRLARELEETARQTASLVDAIAEALNVLGDSRLEPEAARRRATAMIVSALQGQDRIEQRCHGLASATRRFDLLPPDAPEEFYDAIWESLSLDELSRAGTVGKPAEQDAELF
jgi:hypothetical protein